MAGDATSKSGGNLDHQHHHLACSTVLEAVQRRGQQVQGPVDVGYHGKTPEIADSTVLKAVHIGGGLYRARNSLYCRTEWVEAV